MDLQPSELFILLSLILAPVAVVVIIGMFRGYNMHFTKHRVVEEEKHSEETE